VILVLPCGCGCRIKKQKGQIAITNLALLFYRARNLRRSVRTCQEITNEKRHRSQGVKSVLVVFMFCLPGTAVLAQKKKEELPKPAQSIAQLRQQLERILQDTHTPGLSVAIVHRDGPEWIAGLGTSNGAATSVLLIATAYFGYWGVIGMHAWF